MKSIFPTLMLATVACLIIGGAAQAVIVGPYSVDADTLHLWQMDRDDIGSPVNTQDAVSPGGVNVANQNGATWGNPSFPGFDRAADVSMGSNDIIRSGVTNLQNAPTGADGAFTYEAIINTSRIDISQHIFTMDYNTSATRLFFFRIVNDNLSFLDINASTTVSAAIPTTGDDAFDANDWYHVAVTYDGNEMGTDNLSLYWTKLDDSRTEANLIGTGTLTADLSTTNTSVYSIGNEFRGSATQNLKGLIDEVRISGVARGADEFIFGPDTSTLVGDFNGDDIVDLADYTVWRNNLGGDDAVFANPGLADGVVDAQDYDAWVAAFGNVPGAISGVSSAVVPEPATWLLALAGGAFALVRRRSVG